VPLIRGKKGEASGETSGPRQGALDSPDADNRWTAARALAGKADAVPALAVALARESVPRVREAMMTALIRTGNAASIEVLLPYLRSQDASMRAAAIEALQALPDAIAPFMSPLLNDGDSDVRLLATELARNMEGSEAIDVLTEVGTLDALPTLERCAARFAATPFLPFAVSVAMSRISGEES
jgi:HEAT repeat protein